MLYSVIKVEGRKIGCYSEKFIINRDYATFE